MQVFKTQAVFTEIEYTQCSYIMILLFWLYEYSYYMLEF